MQSLFLQKKIDFLHNFDFRSSHPTLGAELILGAKLVSRALSQKVA